MEHRCLGQQNDVIVRHQVLNTSPVVPIVSWQIVE